MIGSLKARDSIDPTVDASFGLPVVVENVTVYPDMVSVGKRLSKREK